MPHPGIPWESAASEANAPPINEFMKTRPQLLTGLFLLVIALGISGCSGQSPAPLVPSNAPGASTPGAGVPAPAGISPAAAAAGSSVAVTLTGTNFTAGSTVSVSGSGVTVSGVKVADATSMLAVFAVAPEAAPGTRTVTIASADGTPTVQLFTVTAADEPAPTITALRQYDGAVGTSLAQVITGTNFGADATVAVSGSGVTVRNLAIVSSTSITATLVFDASAALGERRLTVTSGGVTSAGIPFTVTTPAQVACAPAAQTVIAGGTATFSASSGFASYAWSAPGGSPATGGDTSTFATTYATAGTYTVTVARGTMATCRVTVNAVGIDSFRASPEAVTAGQPMTLSWTGITANAASCSIDQGVGVVPCTNGSVVARPLASTSYTLTMASAAGSRTVSVGVTVTGAPPTVDAPHGSQTFNFTGAQQTLVVPALVTSIRIQASGAQGGWLRARHTSPVG